MDNLYINNLIRPSSFFGVTDIDQALTGLSPNTAAALATSENTMVEMEAVAEYINNNNVSGKTDDIDLYLPQLTPPARSAAERIAEGNSDSSFIIIMSQVMETLKNSSMSDTMKLLSAYQAFVDAKEADMSKLTKEFRELIANLGKAKEDLEQAKSNLVDKKAKVDLAGNNFLAKQEAVQKAQAAVNAAPNDPVARAALDSAQQELVSAQAALSMAQHDRNLAQQNLEKSVDVVGKATAALSNYGPPVLPPSQMPESVRPDYLNLRDLEGASAILTACLLILQELISKNNTADMNNRLKLFIEQQQVLQTDYEKKTQDLKDQADKMKENKEIMKWVNIVFGAVFLVFAIPIMVLISLVIMVVDPILEAVGKPTISETIAKYTIVALTEAIAKGIAEDMAKDPNISKETREMVSNILAAIIAPLIIMATFALTRKFVGKIAEIGPVKNAASKVAEAIASKMSDSVKAAGNKFVDIMKTPAFFKPLEAFCKKFNVPMPKALSYLPTVETVFELGVAGTNGGMAIASGDINNKSMNTQADIALIQSALDNYKEKQMPLLMEQFSRSTKFLKEIPAEVSDVIRANYQLQSRMLSNFRSV